MKDVIYYCYGAVMDYPRLWIELENTSPVGFGCAVPTPKLDQRRLAARSQKCIIKKQNTAKQVTCIHACERDMSEDSSLSSTCVRLSATFISFGGLKRKSFQCLLRALEKSPRERQPLS